MAAQPTAPDSEAMQARVRELYDYDTIVAKAPRAADVQWVFGYGSILFKQGFDSAHRLEGYLKDWRRVFWQTSTDHRGVPEAPGRTVTLVPEEGACVWGIAYKLPDDVEERQRCLEIEKHQQTMQELEWREKQYDHKVYAPLFGAQGQQLVSRVLTYVGSSDPAVNVNWGGEATVEQLAQQIAHAHGPSGPNCEYLYKLADGLRALQAAQRQQQQQQQRQHEGQHSNAQQEVQIDKDDKHVFDIEARVRQIRGDAQPQQSS